MNGDILLWWNVIKSNQRLWKCFDLRGKAAIFTVVIHIIRSFQMQICMYVTGCRCFSVWWAKNVIESLQRVRKNTQYCKYDHEKKIIKKNKEFKIPHFRFYSTELRWTFSCTLKTFLKQRSVPWNSHTIGTFSLIEVRITGIVGPGCLKVGIFRAELCICYNIGCCPGGSSLFPLLFPNHMWLRYSNTSLPKKCRLSFKD